MTPFSLIPARFIPASAGNGTLSKAALISSTVHPRERGERQAWESVALTRLGSSPRARGTATKCPACGANFRFIPASAGNGPLSVWLLWCLPVHPRERGERQNTNMFRMPAGGSSPRARGTGSGSIRLHPKKPVHPRERGERDLHIDGNLTKYGSSPRARGTGPASP